MIDHTGINVSNLEKSKEFYSAALAPLHYKQLKELPFAFGFGSELNQLISKDPGGDFWISSGLPQEPRTHIAFSAGSRKEVDEFYTQAILAGGKDHGAPGLRPKYHDHYYAAFVLDPDGYNIEAVYHLPE
jgi:catechol 2,3-dioxygenase-like lactoylglutathione lyase family enzyme